MIKNCLFVFSIIVGFISNSWAVPAESTFQYKGSLFSYYSNVDFNTVNDKLTKAIVIVHGSERNADTYYRSMEIMAKRSGVSAETLIIAPHFKESSDKLLVGELAWSYLGWWEGDPSEKNGKISSFDIIDNFVRLIANKHLFPSLTEVVITGHSAGGQLTQRYAVGSSIEEEFSDLKFSYVVANPGAYLYISPLRPALDGSGDFYTPFSSCDYNDYKYGLDNLNEYMGREDVLKMVDRYLDRDVTYFLGESDTLENIDQTCAARFQGPNRLERGRNIKALLDYAYPHHNHKIVTVPNVGHTQWGMYTSLMGKSLIFD